MCRASRRSPSPACRRAAVCACLASVEVARTYVTGDVITRMERHVDNLVSLVRDEMKETRETMLKAIMGRSSG